MKRFLLICAGCILFLIQETMGFVHEDEPAVSKVVWFDREMLADPFSQEAFVDTTLKGFQLYDLYDRTSAFYASKGNVGHRARSLILDHRMHTSKAMFHEPWFGGYILSPDNQIFYRPAHVFSELFYVTGSVREQLFYAMHNQRLAENTYIGLIYQSVNSPGVFSRMASRNAGIELKLDTKIGENYSILGSFTLNRLINRESGGLKNHLNFEEDEVRDSVFLYRAETRYRDIGFNIQQSYDASLTNLGVFQHEFSYKRRAFVFDESTNPFPGFYDALPMNPGFTFDSTLVHTTANRLSWSNHVKETASRTIPLHLMLSARHEMISIKQPLFYEPPLDEDYQFKEQSYNQVSYAAQIQSNPKYLFSFNGYANYIMGGYNDGDMDIGGSIAIGMFQHNYRLLFKGYYSAQEAPYFHNHFSGNYIRWDNDFFKQRTMNLGLIFIGTHLQLEANYFLLNRPVFFNTAALPEQHDGTFPVISASLSGNIDLWVLRSKHKMVFQYMGEEQYDRFPAAISYHSLYADFKLFDNALHAHAGFDLRYNTPYRPMAYMPVVRQFYIQDEYKSDHVLLLDAFINAKISRARLFVKLQNILDVIFDMPQYYDIPFYPLPVGMFKFGVSWMFFD